MEINMQTALAAWITWFFITILGVLLKYLVVKCVSPDSIRVFRVIIVWINVRSQTTFIFFKSSLLESP